MNKIICIGIFLAFANALIAGPRVYLEAWYDDPTSLGLCGNASVSAYNGVIPFRYYSLALREIRIGNWSTGYYSIPISATNGFARSGNLQMTAGVSSGDTTGKTYLQNYTVNGKSFSLSFKIGRILTNGADYDFWAELKWPNGVPTTIAGISTSSGVGIVLRTDYDVYPDSYSDNGLDGAGWRPLTAYSDEDGFGWDVSTKVYPFWKNSGYRVLSRMFDCNWRLRTTPPWNLQWIDVPTTTKYYHSYLKGFNLWDYPTFYDDNCSATIQTIDTGGYPKVSQLPGFTPQYGGSDQGAFFVQCDPSPSTTSSAYMYIYISNGASYGSRSIYLRWYYPSYSNSNYNYGDNRYVAYGDSVPGAIRGLLWGSGSIYESQRFAEGAAALKCSSYGNSDKICTEQELYALEFRHWPGQFYKRFILNPAVYVLDTSQSLENYPNAGGCTFAYAVGYQNDSLTIVRTSKAFVFPKPVIRLGWPKAMVYKVIAHELGHTFGMSHQFSNCNFNDGGAGNWNCANGYIMSYSTSPVMNYGPDAKNWFLKAPDNWVQPVCGGGPMDETRYVDGVHTYDLHVNNIIDW